MSKIDEFVSMIVVNLGEELDSGSTIVADDELTLSTLDNFGNIDDGIVTFDDSSGQIKLVDDVKRCSTINEFGWTEIDGTLVVEEHGFIRHLVNEKPIDATIEVSVTGTMIGKSLSVEEMGGSRLLES